MRTKPTSSGAGRTRTRRAATATTLALLAPGMALLLAGPAAAADDVQVERVPGQTRYDTAARAAAEAFGSADTVVLVNGETFPDAMSAAYLAGVHNAPILLTQPGATPAATRQALSALKARKVIVVGGSSAVSPAQSSALSATGLAVTRIAGADRYATAAAVTRAAGSAAVHTDSTGRRTAFLASGNTFADAMAAAPVAFRSHVPVLLTAPNTLPTATATALRELDVDHVVVLGGATAISAGTAAQVDQLPGVSVQRVAGTNRQATAVAVADLARTSFAFGPTTVGLANGSSFADALAAAPLLGKASAPMLLTASSTQLSTETRSYLTRNGNAVDTAKIFGGTTALAASVATTVRDTVTNAPAPTPSTPPTTPPSPPVSDPQPPAPQPDTTAPAPAVLDDAEQPAYSNLTTPATISGTAEAGATVTLHRAASLKNDSSLLDVKVDSGTTDPTTGRFSFTLHDQPEGKHLYYVVVTDTAHNSSDKSPAKKVLIDLTAPNAPKDLQPRVLELGTPIGTITVLRISGHADPDSTIALRELDPHHPTAVLRTTRTGPDGAFVLDVPVEALRHGVDTPLEVLARDDAGNPSAPTALPVTPTITEQSVAGTTGATVLSVAGLATPRSTVVLLDGDEGLVKAVTDTDGIFRLDHVLPRDTTSTWRLVVRDVDGSTSLPRLLKSVTQDSQAPGTPVLDRTGVAGRVHARLTGTAEAGGSVEVLLAGTTIATTDAGVTGTFDVELDLHALPEGEHTLLVRARDAGGNVSDTPASVRLVVDRTAPELSGLSTGPSGPTNSLDVVVSGTTEADAKVTVTIGATTYPKATSVTADFHGEFRIPVTLPDDLADGQHFPTVDVTDRVGLTTFGQAPPLDLDRTKPDMVSITSQSVTGETSASTLVVTGTAEKRATVTLYDGETSLGTTTASSADGAFTVEGSLVDLTPGQEHVLTVRATDPASNRGPAVPLSGLTPTGSGFAADGYYSGTVTAIDLRPDGTGTLTIKAPGSAEPQRFAVKQTDYFHINDEHSGRSVNATEFAAQVKVGDNYDVKYHTSSPSTFWAYVDIEGRI